MSFAVYYNTANNRPRKHFDHQEDAVAWADQHVDKDPEVVQEVAVYKPDPAKVAKKAALVEALQAMREAVDGWSETAKENHEALGHRGESAGQECWRTFDTSDIYNMIEDARRQLM
jgi:hypothetical protein